MTQNLFVLMNENGGQPVELAPFIECPCCGATYTSICEIRLIECPYCKGHGALAHGLAKDVKQYAQWAMADPFKETVKLRIYGCRQLATVYQYGAGQELRKAIEFLEQLDDADPEKIQDDLNQSARHLAWYFHMLLYIVPEYALNMLVRCYFKNDAETLLPAIKAHHESYRAALQRHLQSQCMKELENSPK